MASLLSRSAAGRIQSGDRTDVASFGSGIAYDQLWFAQSGDDLVMSVIGWPQTLTMADWFDGAANRISPSRWRRRWRPAGSTRRNFLS